MDIEAVAMTAAFMWQGAFRYWPAMQESEAPGDSAQTSWVNAITEHAVRVERRWMRHEEEVGSYGIHGVWEYEVSEPFGEALAIWILNAGHLPSDEDADAILEEIVGPFFAQ